MSLSQNTTTPEFEQRVNHIKCDVKNCTYHAENDTCHADIIHVSPCTDCTCCSDKNDTACETFREKNI